MLFSPSAWRRRAAALFDDEEQPSRPTNGASSLHRALLFFSKRAAVLLLVVLPAFFLLHLALLHLYSRILGIDQAHPGRGGHHYGRLGFGDFASFPSRPPPPPLPRPHSNPSHHFLDDPPRDAELRNAFDGFRNAAQCGLDSRDLHLALDPICPDKESSLAAMSGGGRPGFDQPYIPLGCDFRWYSGPEICQIMDRFRHIFIVGDSLQRMIVTALYMLLREDVGLGGLAAWDFQPNPAEGEGLMKRPEDCMCEHQFDKHECSHAPVRRYSDALRYAAPGTEPVCGRGKSGGPSFDISYHEFQQYPTSEQDLQDMVTSLPKDKPAKPLVFIMHHTFWNDVNMTATTSWLDQIVQAAFNRFDFLPLPKFLTHYPPSTRGFPRLFVTANAAGVMKGAIYLGTQGSGPIANFESELRQHLAFRDIDMLGFYNMSVQTSSSDGTHANMRTNLLKAMMVINWLDWVGKDEAAAWAGVGRQ